MFAATFERDHVETIGAMDRGGHDIPRQRPRTSLALPRVGLTRSAIPVRIKDPLGGRGAVELSARVSAGLGLAPTSRGIHVSRVGDVFARLSAQRHISLAAYAARLSKELSRSHEGASAWAEVDATLTYEEKISGVKEKLSLEHLQLFASARGGMPGQIGLGFHHITACPCVQETFRHSFARPHSARGSKMPLLTHTQRCETRLTISNARVFPSLRTLLNCIDAVVVRSQNTLPREFELLNVYRAHAEPQFLEDVLRDLMLALYREVRGDDPEVTIRIESKSMESIHDFDLSGEVEFSVAELDRVLGASEEKTNRADVWRTAKKPAGKNRAAHCK